MLLVCISLVVSCGVRVRLGQGVCIEYAMLLLRNLKCRVFGGEAVFCEVTKKQRLLLEAADVVVPKISRI
jgi:hypothetical protein